MKSSLRVGLGLLFVSSLFAFAGCGDDDDSMAGTGGTQAQGGQASGGAADGADKCEEIAHLCHPVDDGDGPLHACHEQSEVGNAAKCSEIYVACLAKCQAAHDALAQGGAGGVSSGGMTSVGGAETTATSGAASGGAGGAG